MVYRKMLAYLIRIITGGISVFVVYANTQINILQDLDSLRLLSKLVQ
jgi:hypothetical protein